MTRRKRAPHMGWEVMWRIGVAGEDVIGKEVGSSSKGGSPPMTILISFTEAFVTPSQVYL